MVVGNQVAVLVAKPARAQTGRGLDDNDRRPEFLDQFLDALDGPLRRVVEPEFLDVLKPVRIAVLAPDRLNLLLVERDDAAAHVDVQLGGVALQ